MIPATSRYVFAGMLAFISACVAHEAVGHGGACLATGGRIVLLTSVFFRCEPWLPIVDAGGCLMNFLVAGIAWLLLARFKLPEGTRLLTVLIFALNAMWGSGYFLYSAVLDIGDLAGALHGLHANPMWAWRIALGLTGAWLYRGTMRFIAPQLPPRVPLLIAYGSAGAVAVLSALLARAEMLASIREALLESLVASLGLLYLSFARQSPESTAAVSEAAPSARWFAIAGTPIVIAFLLLLGPGIRAT